MNHLTKLESEHADLEKQIESEQKRPARDDIKIATLKREKLRKKDEITAFRRSLEPDRLRA